MGSFGELESELFNAASTSIKFDFRSFARSRSRKTSEEPQPKASPMKTEPITLATGDDSTTVKNLFRFRLQTSEKLKEGAISRENQLAIGIN